MAKSGQHGGNVLQMAEQYGLAPADITDFSANINPLGMPPFLRDILTVHLDRLEVYPDIDYQDLHQALAQHHQLNPHNVVAGNGATELIFLWVQQQQPQHALVVEPTFGEYRRALTRYGCEITQHSLDEKTGFALTAQFLDALSPEYDCLFLCTPNNPTGLIPEFELLIQIVKRCEEYDIALFIDESFIDFMPERQSLIECLNDYPHLYILRSLTKFYALPGLRLGYMVSANEAVLDGMRDLREPWTINALAATAGEYLFRDQKYVEHTHLWLTQQQEFMWQELNQFSALECYPPSANYLFFKHKVPDSKLQEELMQYGILIRSCANYPALNHQYYRVAIKSHSDNLKLIAALKEVLNHD